MNPDDTESFTLAGNEVYIDSERFTQLNGDARIFIEVRSDTARLQSGTWKVEIEAIESPVDVLTPGLSAIAGTRR